MDAGEMFWQDWVVNYGLERQVMLASKMQTTGRVFGSRWFDGLRLAWLRGRYVAESIVRAYGLAALLVLALGGALWFAGPKVGRWLWTRVRLRKVQRGEVIASDAAMLYSRMLDLLKRRGYSKPTWYTPGEFVRTLPPSRAAEIVADLTSAYHSLRYGGHADAAPRMAALLAELERT